MTNKIKGIIIGIVVVLLLAGAFIVLKLTEKPDETDQSSLSSIVSTENVLYDVVIDNVKSVTINNDTGEFVVDRSGIEKWSIKEFDTIPLNTSSITALAKCASKITTKLLVEENATDLAKYGLSTPSAEITVTFMNDTATKEFIIGDETPQSGQHYFAEKGSTKVYTILSNNVYSFLVPKESFISKLLLEEPADDAWPRVDDVILTRPELDYRIRMIFDPAGYSDDDTPTMIANQIMIEPVNAYLDINNSGEITHGIWGLTATEAIFAFPDDIDKGVAGLDKPIAELTVITENNTYTLAIGAPIYALDENGEPTSTIESYYGYFSTVDVIFTFSADSMPWATTLPIDITSTVMTANYIFNLENIVITTNDKVTNFDISSQTSEDDDKLVLNVFKDNVKMDTDYFKIFYQFLLKCPVEEIYFTQPTNEMNMSIKITTNNGGGDILEFYPETDRLTIVKLNGKTSFRLRTTYIERLLANLALLDSGAPITSTW